MYRAVFGGVKDLYINMALLLQDALRGEHGRDFNGARIVVEWARGPKDPAAPRVSQAADG